MTRTFPEIGLQVPAILLPKTGIDMQRWAVVACDQYTSQPEYWRQVRTFVGDHPSTLDLILPEVYLGKPEEAGILASVNASMKRYLEEGLLSPQPPGFVLVDRATAHTPSRKGLIASLDLECYDYNRGATTLIRATEGTIVERLPPRVRIREGATLELPHIMVLIDDPGCTVIEPLFASSLPKLYDFELMQNSGRIQGWLVSSDQDQAALAAALARLAEPGAFASRYAVDGQAPLLYAMGDGNHSLATAKTIWENIKRQAGGLATVANHPARHALVELVNVHDQGLIFEPIHRVLFHVDPVALFAHMARFYDSQGARLEIRDGEAADHCGAHAIPCITPAGRRTLLVHDPVRTLAVGTLQEALDAFLAENPGAEIDYIHGEEVVADLAAKPGGLGFLLQAIDKNDLFRTVILDGALPRKTFSMGEADEKRFYLECRRIRQG